MQFYDISSRNQSLDDLCGQQDEDNDDSGLYDLRAVFDGESRADEMAEQGYDLPFSAQRALSRNHLIQAMGEKTLVAQCRTGAGGTWDGTTENLRRGWSPVFVSDDGSEGAQALIARGAVPVRTLSGLDDLQPAQLQF